MNLYGGRAYTKRHKYSKIWGKFRVAFLRQDLFFIIYAYTSVRQSH